jgi:CheY-like chemotaxis protein
VGDGHRLLQVLTNLVGNALKFTSEGGVSIAMSLVEDLGLALRLRFEVTDTGIGIPESKRQSIFEAFSQADSSMTRRYGGTGLGLSIARQLCGMMQGEIGVTSTVGSGSTFWFTVVLDKAPPNLTALRPERRSDQPQPGPAAHPGPKSAKGGSISAAGRDFQAALRQAGRHSIRILLVEDNTSNMRVTQALLETLGCEVVPARNGLEAVAAYRESAFDLVLMDCQMPEMDGYEATRAIRQIEIFQGRTTPIIALTAHAMVDSRDASLDAGMNDQLTKPLTMSALTSMLLAWLTVGAPTVAAEAPGGGGG